MRGAIEALTPEERYWLKVDRSGGPNSCWPWMAGINPKTGYGVFHPTKRQTVGAHRFALQLSLGRPLAVGMMARHKVCDNPPCCNPAHLAEGTGVDNMADMVKRGRQSRGSKRPQARLDESRVLVIRRRAAAGEALSELASEFGVSAALVTMIVRGQRWRHVGGPITTKYQMKGRIIGR